MSYLRVNTSLEEVESLGRSVASSGSEFAGDTNAPVEAATEVEGNSRTFGDDKYGRQMLEQYKVGTVNELGEMTKQFGLEVQNLGEAVVEYTGRLRGGEDDNRKRHESVET